MQGKFRFVKIAILLAVWIDSSRRLGEEVGKYALKVDSQKKHGV